MFHSNLINFSRYPPLPLTAPRPPYPYSASSTQPADVGDQFRAPKNADMNIRAASECHHSCPDPTLAGVVAVVVPGRVDGFFGRKRLYFNQGLAL